ncbi:MAG: hypothetical protein ACM3TR_09620 [Caulobacteraceae bacterium]
MLTKRQLEDAAKCLKINCADCSFLKSLGDMGQCSVDLRRIAIAQTALTYRAMLEQLTEELRDCFDNGVFYGRLVGSLEKKLNEAETLLKESEGEEGCQ